MFSVLAGLWNGFTRLGTQRLYLKGISTGDFTEALEAILGEGASGLSATNIVRLKAGWESDYKVWSQRDLSQYGRLDQISLQPEKGDKCRSVVEALEETYGHPQDERHGLFGLEFAEWHDASNNNKIIWEKGKPNQYDLSGDCIVRYFPLIPLPPPKFKAAPGGL
jgi:hypothetical protein